MSLKKNWKIYLIHHSHTDIGYTERQDKIANYHRDFIYQAIHILNDIHENDRKEYEGFVWQCENYWQVKNFYEKASPEEISAFEKYVRSGEIGLSGNYLNLTELISKEVLDSRMKQMQEYGDAIGYPIVSGMTADINGYAWGYVDSMYEHGVRHLYSCLHPHHGMFPLYQKMLPFYWESPKGNKILVWNGEHYNFGNEMFLAPHGGASYLTLDEFHKPMTEYKMLKVSAKDTAKTEGEIAQLRIERFLGNLEEEKYPYDFVPMMISGAFTDNAPPSAEIARRVNEWNQKNQGRIVVKMITLDQFFEMLEERSEEIPVYTGDWNDWWADGVGSTPAAVKVFTDARRKYHLCKKLDPEGCLGDETLLDQAAEELTLYAEHTWGYSSSVSEPWETLVGDLEMKKTAYAVNAHTEISKNLDEILRKKGEVSIAHDKPQHYRIINPHDFDLVTTVSLAIELWEYVEGIQYSADVPVEVVEEQSGRVLQSQVRKTARATQIDVRIELKAGEEKDVRVRLSQYRTPFVVKSYVDRGAEGVGDIVAANTYREDIECVETDYYQIFFNQTTGIERIFDKKDQKDLVESQALYAAFSGIYEVTEVKENACETRRKMGRNRKAVSTKRYGSILKNIRIIENGMLYLAVQLDYSLEGCGLYSVFLKIYKGLPRLEATVRIHKQSVWEPENLYISLPFTAGQEEACYLDKTGCIIRPGIDQLPGTNMEFYLLQNGIVLDGGEKTVTIAIKDTPLVTFGRLEAKPIHLCNGEHIAWNHSEIYSWVMNNFWETNFKVDLGGFYEFSYVIATHDKIQPQTAIKICEADNEGVLEFSIK